MRNQTAAIFSVTFGLIIFLFGHTITASAQPYAFPSAYGYGAEAVGGRGGSIIYVTNLNDSGPGSLKAACETSGARTVIFRVAGIIEITSTINITNPYITIAGQTAPGDGICVKLTDAANVNLFTISTHDVVIRYLRFRRGPGNAGECNGDNILFYGADKCIVDHCSFSWSTDELINSWPATKLTLQNNLFAEALHNSTHSDSCNPSGPLESHALGPLMGQASKDITFYRNVFANMTGRPPRLSPTDGGTFQIVNNITYNVCYAMEFIDTGNYNAIGNYIKWGPNSCSNNRNNILVAGNVKVYVEDNITPFRTSSDSEWLATSEWMSNTPANTNFRSQEKFNTPLLPVLSAAEAYVTVVEDVGANKALNHDGSFKWVQDVVDLRNINDVKSGTATNGSSGRQVDHPKNQGGWPIYNSTAPYPDADKDGMSDVWEALYDFSSSDASDRNDDPDKDGYTNLEEFLNGTKPIPEVPPSLKGESLFFKILPILKRQKDS